MSPLECVWIHAIYMRLFDSHWCFYRFPGNLMSVSFLIHFIEFRNGNWNETNQQLHVLSCFVIVLSPIAKWYVNIMPTNLTLLKRKPKEFRSEMFELVCTLSNSFQSRLKRFDYVNNHWTAIHGKQPISFSFFVWRTNERLNGFVNLKLQNKSFISHSSNVELHWKRTIDQF